MIVLLAHATRGHVLAINTTARTGRVVLTTASVVAQGGGATAAIWMVDVALAMAIVTWNTASLATASTRLQWLCGRSAFLSRFCLMHLVGAHGSIFASRDTRHCHIAKTAVAFGTGHHIVRRVQLEARYHSC